jgi:hypothetical protein
MTDMTIPALYNGRHPDNDDADRIVFRPQPDGGTLHDAAQFGQALGRAGITDLGGSITVDSADLATIAAATVLSAASLSVLDDWDETDRAKVNPIVGQAGIAAGTGVDGVTVPRVTLATNVALPTSTGTVSIAGYDFATYSFTQGAADLQVQAVKSAILAHGAVTTSMNALPYPSDPFYAVQNPVGSAALYTMEYVNPFAAPDFADHEVTIIGWDDGKQINVIDAIGVNMAATKELAAQVEALTKAAKSMKTAEKGEGKAA